MNSGIYCIYCIPTRKVYIGQAVDLKQRFRQHRHELYNKKHRSSYLQRAWNKYSDWLFQFHVIEYVEPNKEKLAQREQWWLDISGCCDRAKGYNCQPSSISSLGIKRSDEMKSKISKLHKGRIVNNETKEKIRNARLGYKHSLKAIENMRTAQSSVKKRNFDKWPCAEGIKCKCTDCKEKKRIKMNAWRESKKVIYV